MNAKLHEENEKFGNRTNAAGLATHLPKALTQLHKEGLCSSFLDYGTGKGALIRRLEDELTSKITVRGYDPAVEKYSSRPTEAFDILTCLDVLEHVEMNNIQEVLTEICVLTKYFCYLVIDLQPAVKTLEDGRNAHILLAPPDWWLSKISQLFPCTTCIPIMHRAGLPQKVVIAACHQAKYAPYMYQFLVTLKINKMELSGGILERVAIMKAQ